MDSNLSVSGAVLGILVFILVFRKWKPLGLIEWIGAFLFAGTIGSLLGWLWEILTPTQRESYVVYLVVGLVGLVLLHMGDVITAGFNSFISRIMRPPEGKQADYGCFYISVILVLVTLLIFLEPWFHLISTVGNVIVSSLQDLETSIRNLDFQMNGDLWLIPVGVMVFVLAVLAFNWRFSSPPK